MTQPTDGTWCHVEIGAQDVDRARNFYGECFGWQFQHVPEMNYHFYQTREGGIGGGLMQAADDFPKHMLNYIYCDDVDATTQRVQNNGGQLLKEKTQVGEAGWFTVVSDPEGNVFGLWQSTPG